MIMEGREQLMKPAAISTFGIQGLGRAAEEVKVLRCQLCSLTYFSMLGDGTGVDLEDVQTSLFIRQFDVWRTEVNVRSGVCARTKPTQRTNRSGEDLTDFTIQSSGPQQGWVQSVRSVGGHDHLDSVQCVEAVHLVQQLTGHTHEHRNIMCADGMWVIHLQLTSGNVSEMKCLYAERGNAERASGLNDRNILTSCSESGLHKLFPLQGLKLNVGHRPKSNHYCIVLLRCKMVVGSQVPLRG